MLLRAGVDDSQQRTASASYAKLKNDAFASQAQYHGTYEAVCPAHPSDAAIVRPRDLADAALGQPEVAAWLHAGPQLDTHQQSTRGSAMRHRSSSLLQAMDCS